MRRTLIGLSLLAFVVGLMACAADAPTSPGPGPGGGGTSALQIQLFTTDSNPKAGTCTLVEAIVTLNGNPVPDGTSVSFSTDFGAFSQTGLPLASIVTTDGVAVTALCGPGAGAAKVRATATSQGNTGSANLTVVFQPDSGTLPFVSFCSPSFGPKEGGTELTITGGRFFGSPGTTRVQFTANGITRDGVVQSVEANQIVVRTAGFPELNAPTTPAAVTLILGSNLAQPVTLSLPSCFAYGTTEAGTPTIASILPASGTNEGNTRVTIVGSGFSTTSGVQVFFGAVEASVISVSYNQVVVLSPPAFGAGQDNLNQTVQVTVRNIGSGTTSNGVSFSYTPEVLLTSVTNNIQRVDLPFAPVTIFGQGFQAPVAVTLAGWAASVSSVSATEIVVIPIRPLQEGCDDISGTITVVNINTGDGDEGLSFTFLVPDLSIVSVIPQVGQAGDPVTITGNNFPLSVADAEVRFGTRTALVTGVAAGTITVNAPPGTVTTAPSCTGANPDGTLQDVETVDITVTDRATTCTDTVTQVFTYQLPCVLPTPAP